VPSTLPYGYHFRAGTVARYGALSAASATYTDGLRTLTVFQTAASRMAFPQVGVPMKMGNASARLLDLGYFRVMIWQSRGINYALAGNLPIPALLLVADELTAQRP
jgi:hypothetical protein